MGAVTVVDEDGAAARECARSAVAMYFDVVAALDPTVHVPQELLMEIRRCVVMGDDRAAGRLIPDELLDRFAFCGTPADVSRHVREILDAGAARIEFGAPFGLERGRGLRLLGERVLPELR